MHSIVFIDSEINCENKHIIDLGAVKSNNECINTSSLKDFLTFISNEEYLCGHNVIHHDLKYIRENTNETINKKIIDTLYLSPLLFPKRPYHKLIKDDKIFSEELNNPVNDSKKAKDLFYDEVNAFKDLDCGIKKIYYTLLKDVPEFRDFFKYNDYTTDEVDDLFIKDIYRFKICSNANINDFIQEHPIELAYALAIIRTGKDTSITPPWVINKYPYTEHIINILCNTPCNDNCSYCNENFNAKKKLYKYFQYNDFRKYEDEPLQEKACNAAIHNKSLVAIFPTGGGKSLTFQLPALIAGDTIRGLTVVISPLQSLMKDQIDNLEKKNIVDAISINGLLNPIERANAIERVRNGSATILYISPEQLRSKTIEHILLSRNVVRFVIDEAHCFSAWGQDFRVDYLYIGDFIKKLQEQKGNNTQIAISCFTATAKPKVISDIKDYFKEKLNIDLEIFACNATRKNLRYTVIPVENEDKKYTTMRSLIEQKDCPTIVYVQSVKATIEIAERLTKDGFPALPYNGKMDPKDKIETQNTFINNEVKIIVATSAFGMGVDKQDIEMVIHYEIPSSLEDYMQESGRAAREQTLNADCYILFSSRDTDKHFIQLTRNKLSMHEIQQVWQAIKRLTKYSNKCCRSALEIAREAGWDNIEITPQDIEIKVKTAILALEKAGYIQRKQNIPRVYATSINAKSTIEAQEKIKKSNLFTEEQIKLSSLVISKLIASRNKGKMTKDDAESRVDWLADILAQSKSDILEVINLMKRINLLADNADMSATINNDPIKKLSIYNSIENYIIYNILKDKENILSLKELNEEIQKNGTPCTIKQLRTIFNYWKIKGYIEKNKYYSDERTDIILKKDIEDIKKIYNQRYNICTFLINTLSKKSIEQTTDKNLKQSIQFSVVGLLNEYESRSQLSLFKEDTSINTIEDALLYLHKCNVLSLEGGFIVLYSSMEIIRLITDNKIKYKKDDYKFLDEYYKQKIQQIHIIGELLKILVRSYKEANEYIKDYFKEDYKTFINKYFKGRDKELELNMTPERYKKLFGELSEIQKEIINDKSKFIVVAAGPGSGKTKVLVHKLASLLTVEDVKSEQLLMLTFSRAAAIEFKKRLYDLIGSAASYVDIKTFHSFCFDLLGRPGKLENSENIINDATNLINKDEVESVKVSKSVIVLDEAQDISEQEFNLVQAIINYCNDVRIIAVGDDDQNIYEFRGSSSKYFASLLTTYNATKYEMLENYRSRENIVKFANIFAAEITHRMKENNCITKRENGIVNLIQCNSKNLEEPLLEELKKYINSGSCCILTNTNDEALRMLGLLNKNQIKAKLIQSIDGFRLTDLLEVRYLLAFLEKYKESIQIQDSIWIKMKENLKQKFLNSTCLPIILNLIEDFEGTNDVKYMSDLETFLSEAKFEDFYKKEESNTVIISTIHKAKGHEYDNVLMLMNNISLISDENKRKIYVGLTRAKNSLNIFYNNNVFSKYKNINGINFKIDYNKYNEPEEIILHLTHKDVVLSFFKGRKFTLKFRSGDKLKIDNEYLSGKINNTDIKLVKLSNAARNRINELLKSGYKPVEANIRFIVYWLDKEDKTEVPIILPTIILRK